MFYGSGFDTPDTFSFLERIGMRAFQMSEFTNNKYSTSNEAYNAENEKNKPNKLINAFNESQVKYRAQKLEDIKNINFDSNNPYMFKAQSIFGKESPESIVNRNLEAYNTLININKQGGNVLLWDTETIGDFVGNPDTEIAAKMAGITEIGFHVEQIKGSESGKFNSRAISNVPDGSFLFGINKEQKEWLLSIVDKMESGNEDLSRTEISALERASRYSDIGEDAVQIYTGKWKGETYNFVKKLNKSRPDNAMHIKAGIEVLSKSYEENQNQKMQNVLDYIANFTNNKNNNRVVGGQNLDYDITAVSRYMSMHDMQKNAISERNMQYIDTYVMMQSVADFNNTTPGELVKQVNPTAEANANLGNAIKAVTGETEFADELAHNAQEDSKATSIVLRNNELKLIERMERVVNGVEQYGVETTERNLKDFFIKINKNGHDRRRDIVEIDGVATTSYQVTNQYWQFEGIGEGTIKDFKVDFNYKDGSKGSFKKEGGIQSYAKFTSLDGSGAVLYKAIDSVEDLTPFITNNTSIIEKDKLSKWQIGSTNYIRNNDLARRDIEAWFESNNRGFERFKETYNLYNASLQYTEETGKTVKDGLEDFIQWGKDNKNSAVNEYFGVSKNINKNLSAKELAIKNYDEVSKLPIKFAAIESNKDFFENAYNTITEASKGQEGSNLINTIIFKKLRDEYIEKEASHPETKNIKYYTIEDLNSVSVLTKNGNYSRIDVSNIEVGTNKLLNGNREYVGKTIDQQATINNLINVAKDLNEKGLISNKHYDSMIKSYASGKSSWMFAQSIVSSLNETTKNIRNMDVQKAGAIVNGISTFNTTSKEKESINYRPGLELDIPEANRIISKKFNVDTDTINLFRNKDLTTSSEMAKSIMTKINSPVNGLSNEYIDYSKNIAKTFNDKMLFIKGSFEKEIDKETKKVEKDNFYEIEKTLSKMGYGDEAIGEYRRLFYGGGNGSKLSKSNLKNLNYEHGLVGTDDEIKAMFFKSNNDKSSLFAIYTNNKNYNKVVESLMDLGENATDRDIQNTLKEKASFFKIGQLYKAEIADDDVIKELTGHNAQVVMSNQGNGYIKYESMAFNAYYDTKTGKYTGGILDQGDDLLLTQRRRMVTAYEQMISGNWDRASYNMNVSAVARRSEESAPQSMGILDKNGNIIRSHTPTVKDISSAYMLDLESEGSTIKFKDMFKLFVGNDYITDETGKSILVDSDIRKAALPEGKKAIDALSGIYNIIDEKYRINKLDKNGNKIGSEDKQINRVFNSEEFRIFYEEYFNNRTGGIGSSKLIKDALENTAAYHLSNNEVAALKELGNDGLIDLLAKATKGNKKFDKKLSNVFEILSEKAFIDNSISETATKHGRIKIGKDITITTGAMFNSGYSVNIRPTYPQLENYRPFKLNYGYFEDTEGLENNLGIRFREIFASESYTEKISNLDKRLTRDLSEGTASRRHVIGAIQSMSQSDFNTYRDTRLTNLLNYNKKLKDSLDPEALKKVYNEMIEGVNLYEGKGYLRPSLANNKFYMIGDPKTIQAQEIKNIFELGTDLEIAETEKILRGLEGKSVKSGDVIARKQTNGKWKNITYKGETIEKLTRDDIEELKNSGKAVVNVTKQLESMKIQAGQEKFTAGSLFYYNNVLDDAARNEELKMTLSKFGIDYKDSFEENLKIMNRYTDMAMDAITDTLGFDLKTIAVVNTNTTKHSTDVAIESTWNLLFKDFQGEEGLRELSSIIGDIKVGDNYITDYIKTSEGINYAGLIYNNKLGIDKNVINIQDQIIDRFKKSDNIKAQTAIKNMEYMASHNMAYIGTQRQFMNTFQGKNQKFDRRFYQGLLMQQQGDYTKGYSKNYANLIAKSLKDGVYDKKENIGNIIGFENSEVNRLRANIVRDRRGILSKKLDSDTVFGILESLSYMDDPNSFRLDQKSIIKVSAEDVLKSIPYSGGAIKDYRNTIFKEDGKLSEWMLSKAKDNGLEGNMNHITSNSFYLDLSRYGGAKLNGKQANGVVLPLISGSLSEDGEIFFGKTAKGIQGFLNNLRSIDQEYANALAKDSIDDVTQKKIQTEVNNSLKNLFETFVEETDSSNKDSLISKAEYKMELPNSAGLLASEAITPTLIEGVEKDLNNNDVKTRYNSNRIKNYINEILEDLENDTLDKNKIKRYKDDLRIRQNLIESQQKKILNPKDDPVKYLGISEKYSKYLRSYKYNKKINQWVRRNGVIENAMLVGEQMFTETEMDLGHIGHQIASDMYAKGNKKGILTQYDSLSKFTGTDFMISDEEFKAAFSEENIYKAFDDTTFAEKLSYRMGLMLDEGKFYPSQKNIITEGQRRNRAAFNLFEEELNKYLKSYKVYNNNAEIAALETEAAKKNILNKVEKFIFGEFGAKYAEEVGILGETSRYPFFSETNTLAVRIFLDRTIGGKEGVFLGPQFSLLQNLDFDGDQEFIKFLGNGGLVAKNAAEELTKEQKLLERRFNEINKENTKAFAEALEDSVKEYMYGDREFFKLNLLKDISYKDYERIESTVLGGIKDEETKELLLSLKESEINSQNEFYDLVLSKTKVAKQVFSEWDSKIGTSLLNPEIIKASALAKTAKLYIGNFSKPNLELRDALTWMLSSAKDNDELDKLIKIRNSLFSYGEDTELNRKGVGPKGLLTELEQKGIDTKHIHDAELLNTSTDWRLGIKRLFSVAEGSTPHAKVDITKERTEAVRDLVTGAKKVFFKNAGDDNEAIEKITKEIMESNFLDMYKYISENSEKIQQMAKEEAEEIYGKLYIRAIHEMSLMDGAYGAFKGTFSNREFEAKVDFIRNIDNGTLEKLIENGKNTDTIIKESMMRNYKKHLTDERFNVFGRNVRQGDLLLYVSDDGFRVLQYDEVRRNNKGNFEAIFYEYDIEKEDVLKDSKGRAAKGRIRGGITIRDLNEDIKRTRYKNKNYTLLDFSRIDLPEQNINVGTYIGNIHDRTEYNKLIKRHAAQTAMAYNLQQLFDNPNKFDKLVRLSNEEKAGKKVSGYGGINGSGAGFRTIMSEIVGTDKERFANIISDMENRIEYGLNSKKILGYNGSAKELMREINKQIASDPSKYYKMFTKHDDVASIMKDYLKAYQDIGNGRVISIKDKNILTRNIKDIELSNSIEQEISNIVKERDTDLYNIAEKFYGDITNGLEEAEAFNAAQESYQAEVENTSKRIYEALNKTTNPKESMMHHFGWQDFKTSRKNDFLLASINDKIYGGVLTDELIDSSRIGFGKFTGVKVGDLNSTQAKYIRDEIKEALPNLSEDSIEYLAAKNTQEVLSHKSFSTIENVNLDFTTADTLRKSYESVSNAKGILIGSNEERLDAAISEMFKESGLEDYIDAAKKAAEESKDGMKKKTLLGELKGSFESLDSSTKKKIAIGATALIGLSALGLAGHPSSSDNNNIEVPAGTEENLGDTSNRIKFNNKNDLDKPNTPTQASSVRKSAPPSPKPKVKKNRTIYHDANSGFNFKVSANSYNKLTDKTYSDITDKSGLNNSSLNVTRDNSKITNNWLEEKFAQLTE